MAQKTYTLALAGNPNVGKSTVFNALTGLHQHTGNWPGKTVGTASGSFTHNGQSYILCDLPGTYSLSPHSPEEEAARSMLCFQSPDAVIAVCDACAPERGIQLALQILEICPRVVLCLNLSDEAEKKHIHTDTKKLEFPSFRSARAAEKDWINSLQRRRRSAITLPHARAVSACLRRSKKPYQSLKKPCKTIFRPIMR